MPVEYLIVGFTWTLVVFLSGYVLGYSRGINYALKKVKEAKEARRLRH